MDASADDVEIARWQLERAGLAVRAIRVENAEALRVALTGDAPIDLLAAELVLPGFSWQEALAIAADLRPGMLRILYSGYPDKAQCDSALRGGGHACVTKDQSSQFIELVKQALAREHPNKPACCAPAQSKRM